jgi:hypothetical protein
MTMSAANQVAIKQSRLRNDAASQRRENDRISVAYSAINDLWGDTMNWQQIETLARRVVRALDVAEASDVS